MPPPPSRLKKSTWTELCSVSSPGLIASEASLTHVSFLSLPPLPKAFTRSQLAVSYIHGRGIVCYRPASGCFSCCLLQDHIVQGKNEPAFSCLSTGEAENTFTVETSPGYWLLHSYTQKVQNSQYLLTDATVRWVQVTQRYRALQ